MTARAWPLNAASGAPLYDGRYLRQTTVAPLLLGATSARPLGARSGVRPNTPSSTVTATSTTWTVQPHIGVMDVQTALEAGPYAYSFDAVVTGSVAAASSSYARIDLISVQINDNPEDGSGLEAPSIVYTAGTAAAPALPTAPVRSMTIAQINVPISGGGAPSVTWVAPYLAAAGGTVFVSSQAERDAMTAYDGLQVYRLDLHHGETYSGGIWLVNGGQWVDVLRSTTYNLAIGTTAAALTSTSASITVPTGRQLELDVSIPNVNPATGSGASIWLVAGSTVLAGARVSTSTGVGLITPVHLADSVAGTGGAITVNVTGVAHSGTATVSYDVTSGAPVIFRYRIV